MIINVIIFMQALTFWIYQRRDPIVTLEPTAMPNDYDTFLPFIPRISFAFEY